MRRQGRDHPRHSINRVHAEVRRRTVTRDAARTHLPAHRAFVAIDNLKHRRFGHDGEVRAVGRDRQAGRPDVREFLVDRACQHDRRRARRPLAHQAVEREEHRGHSTFDVAGTSTVQPSPLDDRRERRNRHAFDGNGVLMNVEEHRAPRPGES